MFQRLSARVRFERCFGYVLQSTAGKLVGRRVGGGCRLGRAGRVEGTGQCQ